MFAKSTVSVENCAKARDLDVREPVASLAHQKFDEFLRELGLSAGDRAFYLIGFEPEYTLRCDPAKATPEQIEALVEFFFGCFSCVAADREFHRRLSRDDAVRSFLDECAESLLGDRLYPGPYIHFSSSENRLLDILSGKLDGDIWDPSLADLFSRDLGMLPFLRMSFDADSILNIFQANENRTKYEAFKEYRRHLYGPAANIKARRASHFKAPHAVLAPATMLLLGKGSSADCVVLFGKSLVHSTKGVVEKHSEVALALNLILKSERFRYCFAIGVLDSFWYEGRQHEGALLLAKRLGRCSANEIHTAFLTLLTDRSAESLTELLAAKIVDSEPRRFSKMATRQSVSRACKAITAEYQNPCLDILFKSIPFPMLAQKCKAMCSLTVLPSHKELCGTPLDDSEQYRHLSHHLSVMLKMDPERTFEVLKAIAMRSVSMSTESPVGIEVLGDWLPLFRRVFDAMYPSQIPSEPHALYLSPAQFEQGWCFAPADTVLSLSPQETRCAEKLIPFLDDVLFPHREGGRLGSFSGRGEGELSSVEMAIQALPSSDAARRLKECVTLFRVALPNIQQDYTLVDPLILKLHEALDSSGFRLITWQDGIVKKEVKERVERLSQSLGFIMKHRGRGFELPGQLPFSEERARGWGALVLKARSKVPPSHHHGLSSGSTIGSITEPQPPGLGYIRDRERDAEIVGLFSAKPAATYLVDFVCPDVDARTGLYAPIDLQSSSQSVLSILSGMTNGISGEANSIDLYAPFSGTCSPVLLGHSFHNFYGPIFDFERIKATLSEFSGEHDLGSSWRTEVQRFRFYTSRDEYREPALQELSLNDLWRATPPEARALLFRKRLHFAELDADLRSELLTIETNNRPVQHIIQDVANFIQRHFYYIDAEAGSPAAEEYRRLATCRQGFVNGQDPIVQFVSRTMVGKPVRGHVCEGLARTMDACLGFLGVPRLYCCGYRVSDQIVRADNAHAFLLCPGIDEAGNFRLYPVEADAPRYEVAIASRIDPAPAIVESLPSLKIADLSFEEIVPTNYSIHEVVANWAFQQYGISLSREESEGMDVALRVASAVTGPPLTVQSLLEMEVMLTSGHVSLKKAAEMIGDRWPNARELLLAKRRTSILELRRISRSLGRSIEL